MFDKKLKKMFMGGDEAPEQSSPISEEELMSKMQILEELRDQMADLMADKMQGHYGDMQKVTVAARSPEGLAEGLEKAEDVVSESGADFHDEDESDYELDEDEEDEA